MALHLPVCPVPVLHHSDFHYRETRDWVESGIGRVHHDTSGHLRVAFLRSDEVIGQVVHRKSGDRGAGAPDDRHARHSSRQSACLFDWAQQWLKRQASVQQQANAWVLRQKFCQRLTKLKKTSISCSTSVKEENEAKICIQQKDVPAAREPRARLKKRSRSRLTW